MVVFLGLFEVVATGSETPFHDERWGVLKVPFLGIITRQILGCLLRVCICINPGFCIFYGEIVDK